MKDRIRELMEMDGLNATEFSKKVKINSSVVSNILNAKNQPSFDVIQKIIAAYPEVDIAWLMTGQGDVFGGMDDSELASSDASLSDVEAESSLFAPDQLAYASQAAESSLQTSYDAAALKNAKEKGRKKAVKFNQPIVNQELVVENKPEKQIKKIIIVYQDQTFEEILPR